MITITRNEAKERIRNTNGHIFKATFRKKDGKFRRMICRLGVKKFLKGIGLKFNPENKGLIVVFDMQKNNYRMINLNTLLYLTIDEIDYKIGEIKNG